MAGNWSRSRSFGETLRRARLERGLSLADAERDTRINRRYLEALEAEDHAGLPPSVYARGFVRSYAEYLGLNAEALIELYQPPDRREAAPTLHPALPHLAIPREVPIRPILYGLGALAAVGLLIYLWILLQSAAAVVRTEQGTQPASRAGTPTIPARLPTPNPIVVPSPNVPGVPSTSLALPVPSPTPVVDGILVELRTTARVYVEAAVDGQRALAETLPGGSQRALPIGRESVTVLLSNGSAVEIIVNGQRQEPLTSTAPARLTWQR